MLLAYKELNSTVWYIKNKKESKLGMLNHLSL